MRAAAPSPIKTAFERGMLMLKKIFRPFPKLLKRIAAGGICAAAIIWGAAGAVTYASPNVGEESGMVTQVTTITTPMETEISNVTTSVPQTAQTTVPAQSVTEAETTLPYNEPESHDAEDTESILDLLDLNNNTSTLDLIILLTILSLAPSILIMMTCFTRIIISFSLLRNAMGVQSAPPNQVMIGLALFLTLFIMSPVIDEMNEAAYVPYKNGEYTAVEAVQAASVPLKEWMLKNTSNETMAFFINLSGEDYSAENDAEFVEKISFRLVAPAFILSEIKIGFQIGFLLFIPFLVIDLVVSSVLMSMGMMMMPPSMVSMPFKILMFVLVDGWQLLAGSLVNGFNV